MRPIGRIVAVAAVGTMALGLTACSRSEDTSSTNDSSGSNAPAAKVECASDSGEEWEKSIKEGDGSQTIYLVSKGFQHRFWQAVKEGAEEAGKACGYKIQFVGPQNEKAVTEQTDQLNTAFASKPAAIGFAALDSAAAAETLDKIKAEGIPVIAFDSGVDSDIPVTTVQTDNYAAAGEAAKHMIEILGDKQGSVGMVCHDQTSTTGKQRCAGFKDYFEKNAPSNLTLVQEQYAGEVGLAADTAKGIIQANSDIVGMYGSNEAAASGVVQGVSESGKSDVTIVGFDSGKPQQDAIKDGSEAGAITQSPKRMGELTVKAAIAAINKGELPNVIDSGFAWYTKDNIADSAIAPNLYE